MNNEKLIKKAQEVAKPQEIRHSGSFATVGCALLSKKGNLYQGVCIDTCSGMGFCAEHSAIAAMTTNGETKIEKIVSVSEDGRVLPPCGRCREFMSQIDEDNLQADVVMEQDKTVKLDKLLPMRWD